MNIFNSYKSSIGFYYRKRIRSCKKNDSLLQKLITPLYFKPVFNKGNTLDTKIEQIRKTLLAAKYANIGRRFVYSIDEKCIPVLRGRCIDNMPLDYSIITEYSLDDLYEFSDMHHNSVSKQNKKIIAVLSDYIDAFTTHEPENDYMSYITGIKYTKARSLEEALQRILFINQILWQTRHTLVGLGRLDMILNRFDIPVDAEEIITDFLVTLNSYYNFKSNQFLGDTGQLIELGGKNQDGSYSCNKYTYLFIQCINKMKLPDPKLLLRCSTSMPRDLLYSAIECVSGGTGSPLLSNDDIIIPALIDFGYDVKDACNYGVSACWEPLSIGNSLEQNNLAQIEFGRVMNQTILDGSFFSVQNIDELLGLYFTHLEENIKLALKKIDAIVWEPDPIQTLFTFECSERDKDISEGGAKYNNYGILSVGMSSAVNSLLNIKHYCLCETPLYSLSDVVSAIKENYKSHELYVDFADNKNGFGSESAEAILLTNRIIKKTISYVESYRNRFGGKVKFGLSSFAYLSKGIECGATADGRKDGKPFATHISNENNESITQVFHFASRLEYEGCNANSNTVDVVIQSQLLKDNIDKFVCMVSSAFQMGVFQIQFNVISYKQLVDAKRYPEKYPNLIVRVWGFSAYFNDLPEEYKDQLIFRAGCAEGLIKGYH